MSWKKPILLAILFYPFHNQLHAQASAFSTIDVLKSFQVGREWTYRYGISGSPSYNFFFDTTSIFPCFYGFQTVKVDSIILDSTSGIRTFCLTIRTTGTEEVINWGGSVLSTRQIDSIHHTSIVENFNLNYRAGMHHIKGWLFLDSLARLSRRCHGIHEQSSILTSAITVTMTLPHRIRLIFGAIHSCLGLNGATVTI